MNYAPMISMEMPLLEHLMIALHLEDSGHATNATNMEQVLAMIQDVFVAAKLTLLAQNVINAEKELMV